MDDKLGLLWFIYTETGRSITAAAPGTARLQLAEGLLNQVKALSFDDQLQFMRDLVANVDTPLTRAYGVFSPNTKLAFWYQLAELMKQGFVVPVPPVIPSAAMPIACLQPSKPLTLVNRLLSCGMQWSPWGWIHLPSN